MVALITGKEKHDQVALKLLPNCFPNRPKTVPKSSQKGSREALGTLPGGSWDPPGRPGATQEHPKSTKMRPRPAQERPKSANPREMVPQRAPKMDLKSIKMGIKIEVGFCIDVSSIFYRFLMDFGYQNGVQNRLQKCIKISTEIQLKFIKKR